MNIKNMPKDIYYNIFLFLDYISFSNLIYCIKEDTNFFIFFKKKANILNNFFYKKFFTNFSDLKSISRKGHLINLVCVLNNPQRYIFDKIQCISWFQYNFSYFEPGYIIEGYIHCVNGVWIITDSVTKRIHPLIKPFIFPKSIRIIY